MYDAYVCDNECDTVTGSLFFVAFEKKKKERKKRKEKEIYIYIF